VDGVGPAAIFFWLVVPARTRRRIWRQSWAVVTRGAMGPEDGWRRWAPCHSPVASEPGRLALDFFYLKQSQKLCLFN
jgi:hypothetical protein